MSHLIAMQEGSGFGLPVWHLASRLSELPHVYAPRSLGDRRPEDARSWINTEKVLAWYRSYVKPAGTVTFGRFGPTELGLYLPQSAVDFNWLCRATVTYGGCIEIVLPIELGEQQLITISDVWSTTRPLRYLNEQDVCSVLETPWAYFLGVYNYDPCVSVFVAESECLLTTMSELTSGVEECYVYALNDALAVEQRNWEDIYRQFEQSGPISSEQRESQASFKEFREEFERRDGK